MTWKDLKRFISNNNNTNDSEDKEIQLQSERFAIFRGLPFWTSDIEKYKAEDIKTNGNCCFNHVISLPRKDGKEYPIFSYEMQLVNALDNHKSVFVKKARGLGITEILEIYGLALC